MVQRPPEAVDVGGTETLLALSFFQKKLTRIGCHKAAYNSGRSIRRSVIDDQDMISLVQTEYGPYDGRNIVLLVISRYDD